MSIYEPSPQAMDALYDQAKIFARVAGVHLLAALTADGPVILLPDTGEGVRVAKLWDAFAAWEGSGMEHTAEFWPDFLDGAREADPELELYEVVRRADDRRHGRTMPLPGVEG